MGKSEEPKVSNPWREAIEAIMKERLIEKGYSFQSLEGGY